MVHLAQAGNRPADFAIDFSLSVNSSRQQQQLIELFHNDVTSKYLKTTPASDIMINIIHLHVASSVYCTEPSKTLLVKLKPKTDEVKNLKSSQ